MNDEIKLALDSASLSLAGRVIALRHFGISCTGGITFNGSWSAKLDISADSVQDVHLRVANLTGIYALEKFDLTSTLPGVELRKCSPLDSGIRAEDMSLPTTENEVTEAAAIVADQWPAIVAEWQQIKEKTLLRRPE